MEQTNVIMFPTKPPESDRLHLYRDEPCTILILPTAQIGLYRSHQPGAQAQRGEMCVPAPNTDSFASRPRL
jgi:hypothetical protein